MLIYIKLIILYFSYKISSCYFSYSVLYLCIIMYYHYVMWVLILVCCQNLLTLVRVIDPYVAPPPGPRSLLIERSFVLFVCFSSRNLNKTIQSIFPELISISNFVKYTPKYFCLKTFNPKFFQKRLNFTSISHKIETFKYKTFGFIPRFGWVS